MRPPGLGFTGMPHPGLDRRACVQHPLSSGLVAELPDPAARAEASQYEIAAYTPRLIAFAVSLGNDRADAEDLAQETCIRALGARYRFTPDTNLKAWLFTILRNLHLNSRRNQGSRPRVIPLETLSLERSAGAGIGDAEFIALRRADHAEMIRAFRTLPPTFAVPLHLAAVEDMTYAAIAALLDIPIGTVMSRIYRARRLLISRFDEARP